MCADFETSFCAVRTDIQGITCISYPPDTDLDIRKFMIMVRHFYKHTSIQAKPLFLINDLRNLRSVCPTVMRAVSSEQITRFISAEAFVVDNLSSLLLVNFFLKRFQPALQHEKFAAIDEAVLWLTQKQLEQKN